MSFHSFGNVVHALPRLLIPVAALLTTYLYLYPVFQGCVFPSTDHTFATSFRDTLVQHVDSRHPNPIDTCIKLAPFRLLVLADPQLEGDSSLPDPEDALSNKLSKHWNRLTNTTIYTKRGFDVSVEVLNELVTEDIPNAFGAVRKRLDLFGNDYYLAHIFHSLHWWTKPTHVTVLGDLIGSQWVDDEEFEWRSWRYWNRVFRGGRRVEDEIMELTEHESHAVLNMDDPEWTTRVVNLAGNHDIGYAGDISKSRMDRFEEKYGKANWDVRFVYPPSRTEANQTAPTIHLVVLNSMLLDTPAMDEELQGQTYTWLNDLIQNRLQPVEDHSDFTLLLTHVPLHKKEGTCVDAPFFEFWDDDDDCGGECKPKGLREQNHLSDFASHSGLLQALFGMSGDLAAAAQGKGRPGLVLTGHDHEGCDTWHYVPNNSTFRKSQITAEEGDEKETDWSVSRLESADVSTAHTGVREVTLRSMMGEFGGNAGLLSMWFDFEQGQWQYEIQMCKLGVQHIWWAIHIIDIIALVSVFLSGALKAQRILNNGGWVHVTTSKSIKVD